MRLRMLWRQHMRQQQQPSHCVIHAPEPSSWHNTSTAGTTRGQLSSTTGPHGGGAPANGCGAMGRGAVWRRCWLIGCTLTMDSGTSSPSL